MFKSDKVFILPCDGTPEGYDEPMTKPRTGFFAIKFGKGQLEHALQVECSLNGLWHVHLNGFPVASSSHDWRSAFGKIFESTIKSNGMLLGRPLSVIDYCRLSKSRAADKERGIDLSAPVNLNSVEPPSFRSKKK